MDQPASFPLVDPRTAPGARAAQPEGLVAASQLAIPAIALKEAERSQKAFEAGDILTSAEHLEKAVLIYPPFCRLTIFSVPTTSAWVSTTRV